jgi:hypothetical protein
LDPYADLYFPGGIFHIAFGKGWGESVKAMDLNTKRGDPPRGVKPVDEDRGGALVAAAVEARREAPGVYEGLRRITFRDDRPEVWGVSMLDWSIHTHLGEVERPGVPIYRGVAGSTPEPRPAFSIASRRCRTRRRRS